MNNSDLILDKIFNLTSAFFQIQPTNVYEYNDLEYEESENEFFNKLNIGIYHRIDYTDVFLNKLADGLAVLLYFLMVPEENRIEHFQLLYSASNENEGHVKPAIRNYGGFYSGRVLLKKMEEDSENKFIYLIMDLISKLLTKVKKEKTIEKPLHFRTGKMYRGHLLD